MARDWPPFKEAGPGLVPLPGERGEQAPGIAPATRRTAQDHAVNSRKEANRVTGRQSHDRSADGAP